MRPEATPKNQTKGARRTLRRVYFTTVPLQKDGATLMGELALFCRDTHFLKETETIGTGEATILHYRAPRGFGKKKREVRFLSGMCHGMYGIQPSYCTLLQIPCLMGDASRLVMAHLPALLPRKEERISLFPGTALTEKELATLSAHVPFLEIIGDGTWETLTEAAYCETGICIPVRSAPSPGFFSVRLPGASQGKGLDLSDPEKSLRFLPPPPLRKVWTYAPKTGAALDALLTFFDLSPVSASVFLSNFTK